MNIFYDYYINVFKNNYIKFSGRATRSEFWYFALFNLIMSTLFVVSDVVLGTVIPLPIDTGVPPNIGLSTLYSLIVFLPSLALSFRRLHDIGKSAWWLFIILVPVIGFFILLYFYVKAGDETNNKYGTNPLSSNSQPLQGEANEESTPINHDISQNMLMDDTQKRAKSSGAKKIFKIIGILLLVIFVVAGALFFFMGSALLSVGKTIVAEANPSNIITQFEQKGDTTVITIPLKENYALVYNNLNLCTPKSAKKGAFFKKVDSGEFGNSSSCMNNQCSVSVSLKDMTHYPKQILAYVKEGNTCTQKSIPTQTKPTIKSYTALIEMTPALLTQLKVKGNTYKVSVSKTNTYNSWQLMGTKKVSFNYNKKVSRDTLMIDGIKKANIIYTNKKKEAVNTVVLPKKPLIKTPTPTKKPIIIKQNAKPSTTIQQLESEKRALGKQKREMMLELQKLQEEQKRALNKEKESLLKALKEIQK